MIISGAVVKGNGFEAARFVLFGSMPVHGKGWVLVRLKSIYFQPSRAG